jgi:hypothetical protein
MNTRMGDNPPLEEIQRITRLSAFIVEQRRHWKRLRKGVMPEKNIIEGWIESCKFALEDLKEEVP